MEMVPHSLARLRAWFALVLRDARQGLSGPVNHYAPSYSLPSLPSGARRLDARSAIAEAGDLLTMVADEAAVGANAPAPAAMPGPHNLSLATVKD